MNTKQLYYPFGNRGQFALAQATGAMAAGGGNNQEVLQFRWTSASKLAVIQELIVTGMRATTAFAAGAIDIKATIARSFTAAGTGGTVQTLTGNNNKLRTDMDTSIVGEVRVATTAPLGAGTKTLDSQDVGNITTHSSGGVGSATPIIGSIYLPRTELFRGLSDAGQAPIILAENEGIVIRVSTPITGVWNLGMIVKWAEVDGF